jgi:hypothetical protein
MVVATVALHEAIEELYRVFERYPLRRWTEPCMHCRSEEDERAVHRRSLRELSSMDLSEFAADSLMTWGELVDLKHFLPRIFEIVAKEGFEHDYPDTETVVGALKRGDWQTWPRNECDAVDHYLHALWRAHLDAYPAIHHTDTIISAIATSSDDMRPFLHAWEGFAGEAPAIHFAEFLTANSMNAAMGKRLTNPWLSDRPAQEAQIRNWLLAITASFLLRLEDAFFAAIDEESQVLLDAAIALARDAV